MRLSFEVCHKTVGEILGLKLS